MITGTINEYALKVIKIILYKAMCPQKVGGCGCENVFRTNLLVNEQL